MQKAKKSLSQNFLIDKNISTKILNKSSVKNKVVLEIGPGLGFLTETILEKKPKKLILVEKDYKLTEHLKEKFKNNNKIIILCEDIFNYNFNKYKNLIIISNLPYNVSSKIILYLFNFNKNIQEMVFMIQKEVAQKFDYNLPKMNKYKFFTRIVSNYSRCFDVSNNVFKPIPKVTSTVVKFNFINKEIDLTKAKIFSKLIFKNIRKKISNNINMSSKNDLFNKRINELTIKELLIIYDLF